MLREGAGCFVAGKEGPWRERKPFFFCILQPSMSPKKNPSVVTRLTHRK